MTALSLNYPPDEAKVLVKAAFELTDGIKTYYDSGSQITGKTGGDFLSYGESVTVEISDQARENEQTHVAIHAAREVDINVTSDPDRYKARFLSHLNNLRGEPVEEVLDQMESHLQTHQTKEVTTETDQASGKDKLVAVFVLILIFTLCMMLLPVLML